MEGFTNVQSRRRNARKERKAIVLDRLLSDTRIPGASWLNVSLNRCHLPGIPYSYYDEEIVMIRQRTTELIERQRAEARAQARARRRHPVPEDGDWYKLENGHLYRTSEWKGVNE